MFEVIYKILLYMLYSSQYFLLLLAWNLSGTQNPEPLDYQTDRRLSEKSKLAEYLGDILVENWWLQL